MKHITQVGMLISALVLCIAGNSVPAAAIPEELHHLIITEVSPEALDGASKESIQIYNPNLTDVDITGWIIQYRSASYKSDDTKGWSTRAVIGCQSTKSSDCSSPHTTTIEAKATLRLSSYETGEGMLPLASGMATTGGVVRLVEPGEVVTVHDKVGYGAAVDHEGAAAAPAPRSGQGITRSLDAQESPVDTDENGLDFVRIEVEDDPADSQNPEMPATGEQGGTAAPKVYLDVEVSELLPDPVSPQTDSDDEFIELYNPHGEAVDLTGYALVTGSSWSHKYIIKDVELAPYDYVTLTSAQTNIALSNTGTGVRLYDPSGKLVFEVPTYGKAKAAQSWVRDGSGAWVWTTKLTPEAQNIVEVPVAATKEIAAKKPASKSTATKKASAPKTTAVKGAATIAPSSQPSAEDGGNQVGMWVLIVAAVLGVGYAVFEYRQDIAGFVRKRWEAVTHLGRK